MKKLLMVICMTSGLLLGWSLSQLLYRKPTPVTTENLWVCPEGHLICDYNGKLVAAKPSRDSDCMKPDRPCTTFAQVFKRLSGRIIEKPLTINYAAGDYEIDCSQKVEAPVKTPAAGVKTALPNMVIQDSKRGDFASGAEYAEWQRRQSSMSNNVIVPQPGPAAFASEKALMEWERQNWPWLFQPKEETK